jgi:hypothetical protein
MNVDTISMDPRIAPIHFKDYRKKVREAKAKREAEAKKLITEGNKMRREAYAKLSTIEKEDIIAMESYRAMMKGQRILNLHAVLKNAGLNEKQRLPKLAVARASWAHVTLRLQNRHVLFHKQGIWPSFSYKTNRYQPQRQVIPFAFDTFGTDLTNGSWRSQSGLPTADGAQAVVPSIPAHLRPEGDLDDYFILFDAKWEKFAPPDPILLKHVSGHMYAVVAQWDLTDLEKAVLEGRFS